MARPYFWKYIDSLADNEFGISGAHAAMAYSQIWGSGVRQDPQWDKLYAQVSSGQSYDKDLYEKLVGPVSFYDTWYKITGYKDVEKWHQEDLAAEKARQDEALKEQQAKLERQKQEQEAALERQRQEVAAAAAKAQKEREFKAALDAMNQRGMPRKTEEEFIGATEDDPKAIAAKKRRKVGWDATKVTGLLGTPNTHIKQLLGM